MSKRKRKKPKNHLIVLKEGRFYNVHDGSRKGHPGRIEIADYINNVFFSITTHSLTEDEYMQRKANSSFRKDYIELSVPTSQDVYKSYINKRPFIGTRDDFGDKEYLDMAFNREDEKKIDKVKKKKPRQGYWFKRKKIKAFN